MDPKRHAALVNSETYGCLVAAILAAPDDDLPRLIAADFWDDNGEPERAEFIRVQLERAKYVDGQIYLDPYSKADRHEYRRMNDLDKRFLRLLNDPARGGGGWWASHELLGPAGVRLGGDECAHHDGVYSDRWNAPDVPTAMAWNWTWRWTWSRGFIEKVEVQSVPDFREGEGRLTARCPVRELVVHAPPRLVEIRTESDNRGTRRHLGRVHGTEMRVAWHGPPSPERRIWDVDPLRHSIRAEIERTLGEQAGCRAVVPVPVIDNRPVQADPRTFINPANI